MTNEALALVVVWAAAPLLAVRAATLFQRSGLRYARGEPHESSVLWGLVLGFVALVLAFVSGHYTRGAG